MVLGITGCIGTGKSAVANILSEMNVPIINADKIGHDVLENKEVVEILEKQFGDIIEDGKVSRKKLSGIVFLDENKLRILNSILHPIINDIIISEIQRLKKVNKVIGVEIPLLYECNLESIVDKVLVVYSELDIRLDRLEKRGISKEDAMRRIAFQIPIEEKIKRADYLINNNGTLNDLKIKVADLLKVASN